MKADRGRGRQGTWLRDVRKARGYTNAQMACEALLRLTGHTIHYSAWAAYEAGSRPIGEQHTAWLEEFFGPMPEAAEGGDGAELAVAIRELVAAVREQTRVMAELVAAPHPNVEEVVARSVEAALLAAGVREASSSLSRSVAPLPDQE